MSNSKNELITQAAIAIGCATPLEILGESQNLVFRSRLNADGVAVRVTSRDHRSKTAIGEELRFVRALSEQLASPCVPIRLESGEFIAPFIHEGAEYYAVAFEYAEGRAPDLARADDVRFFGRGLAELHNASQRIQTRVRRRSMTTAPYYRLIADDGCDLTRDVHDWLGNLRPTPDTFGLLHGDYGTANVVLAPDGLRVFDFDDACHGWFAYDIANALYVEFFDHRNDPELKAYSQIHKGVLAGYAEVRPLQTRPQRHRKLPHLPRPPPPKLDPAPQTRPEIHPHNIRRLAQRTPELHRLVQKRRRPKNRRLHPRLTRHRSKPTHPPNMSFPLSRE